MPGRAGLHFSILFLVFGDPTRGFPGQIPGFLNGIWGPEIVWIGGPTPSFSCFFFLFRLFTHLGGRQAAPNPSLGADLHPQRSKNAFRKTGGKPGGPNIFGYQGVR